MADFDSNSATGAGLGRVKANPLMQPPQLMGEVLQHMATDFTWVVGKQVANSLLKRSLTCILCDGQTGEFYSIINKASRLARDSSGTLVRRESPAEPPSHEPTATAAGLVQWVRT